MKPYRKNHLRLIAMYQDIAADWAAVAMTARIQAMLFDEAGYPETHRHKVAEAIEAAAYARDWSASARELYDEFLERERNNDWLRIE